MSKAGKKFRKRLKKLPKIALRPDSRKMLDDVVVEDVVMYRAELMSEGDLWMCCYLQNGERITFQVIAEKKGLLHFGVGECPEHVNWDKKLEIVPAGYGNPWEE